MWSFLDAKPPKEHHPDKGHILPIVALLVTLVAVCGMVFFLTLKKRKKQQPDSSHEHGESALVLPLDTW